MRKVIINQNTLKKTENELYLACRETYLRLQKLLVKSLDWDTSTEEKKKIAKQIKELGKIFLELKEKFKKS